MNFKNSVIVAGTCVVLAACGGGGGGGGGAAADGGVSTGFGDRVPESALGSVGALLDYMKQLIGNSSDSAEPLALGNITLPVDDTAEPAAL